MAAVADALQFSTSAVSQQLRRLEREAGVPLLEPDGRSVRLTAAGEALAERAVEVVAALERATVEVAALREDRPSGRVRLGCIATVAHTVLPEIVRLLAERDPSVDLHVRTVEPEAAIDALAARKLDIVIVDEYHGVARPVRPDLVAVSLAADSMWPCMPTGAPADVDPASVPWVLEPAGSDAAAWAISVCRQHGFEPRVRYESPDLMSHARFASQGLAAAFVPQLVIAASPEPLVPFAGLDARLERTIRAVVRSGTEHHPAIRAVVDAAAAAF